MRPLPTPGLASQEKYRTAFRVLGVLALATGLVLTIVGFTNFFAGFSDPSGEMPTRFFLTFIGLPLVAVGLWLLQAGFLGAATRYAAGETMPVVKDAAAYLTDGEGIHGVGRAVDDERVPASGPSCRSCGVRNDADARFCDGCGQPLA